MASSHIEFSRRHRRQIQDIRISRYDAIHTLADRLQEDRCGNRIEDVRITRIEVKDNTTIWPHLDLKLSQILKQGQTYPRTAGGRLLDNIVRYQVALDLRSVPPDTTHGFIEPFGHILTPYLCHASSRHSLRINPII